MGDRDYQGDRDYPEDREYPGDRDYPPPYLGLHPHSLASRPLPVMEQTGQHGLENVTATHYRAPMSMAPPQSSNLAVESSLDHTGSMHYQAPLAMWQNAQSQSSNLAAIPMMPQNQQHNAAALSMMLQSQGLPYYPGSVRMFPSPMQQTHNSQFYHASAACSKRFSEDEKQKLEKVFTDETQKPSTSRKRQLAEELGCPVPKVNNWFQNRRAREKQNHRVQEYAASQAAARAASDNDGVDLQEDDDNEDGMSSEFDSMSNRSQTRKSSSDRLTETDDSSGHEDPSLDSSDGRDSDGSETDSPVIRPIEAGSKKKETDGDQQAIKAEFQSSSQPHIASLDISLNSTTYEGHQGILSSSPEIYAEAQSGIASLQAFQNHFASNYPSLGQMTGLGVLDNDVKHRAYFTSTSFMSQRTPTITTNVVDHDEMHDHSTRRPSEISEFSGLDSLSLDMAAQTSPTVDQADLNHNQASPYASIASRRKIRPPQRLNQTALRNYENGPKTGAEGPKRSEMYGTMRRAASANGQLSWKISKSGHPVSPLSPRSFDPNFLEQLARATSFTATSPLKDVSSTSPVGPQFDQRYLSVGMPNLGIQHRSSTLSLNSFGESSTMSPSIAEHGHETSLNGAQQPGFQHFQHPKFSLDTGGGNATPDEALTTPGLSQFGSEVEFPTSLPAPRYIESEPATPSYLPVTAPSSSTAQAHGYPTLKIETPPQSDVFPWSLSPDQMPTWNGSLGHFGEPQSQTFQFQPNITPQNFNSPNGT